MRMRTSRSLDCGVMAKPPLTDAIQDYLREIYKLGLDGGRVTVTALAKRLGVSPASASAMVKKLAALYLAETLGVDVDKVHNEAERLEHALSEELEERIDRALGFPTHDPHGDPIPDANLRWPSGARKTSVRGASAARRA